MKFYPGIVGGHCIGVDPYYLTYKSQQLGYKPEIILAGRRINDSIGRWMVERLVLKMCQMDIKINSSEVLILGLSFKENCPDLRNTKVLDIIDHLKEYAIKTTIVDPIVSIDEALKIYNLEVKSEIPENKKFDSVILCVSHNEFKLMSKNKWKELGKNKSVFVDLKGIIPKEIKSIRL